MICVQLDMIRTPEWKEGPLGLTTTIKQQKESIYNGIPVFSSFLLLSFQCMRTPTTPALNIAHLHKC